MSAHFISRTTDEKLTVIAITIASLFLDVVSKKESALRCFFKLKSSRK